MELYDMMQNIRDIDILKNLQDAILVARGTLSGLTTERMCKVYSSCLYKELNERHIPARIINTLDLGLNYEHIFLLVPDKDETYFLADLTFEQFYITDEKFACLVQDGYKKIDDNDFRDYLKIVSNEEIPYITIDNAYFMESTLKR